MQRRLLEVLQCPTCAYAPLQLVTDDLFAEVEQGTLHCEHCGRQTAIREGIVDALGDAPVALTGAQLTNYLSPAAWGYERLWRWQSLSLLTGEHFPLRRELRLVQALLEPERGGVLIDVACSAALYARSWSASTPPDTLLIGVDHSWAMLREARRRSFEAPRPISLVRAAAQALPFQAASATGVGMGGSLNEIGDADGALREIRRLLAPDGRFVSMNLLQASSGRGRALQRVLAEGGVAFPTLETFNQQLERAGLQRWAQWRWGVVAITATVAGD
ncbi:MAG: class I SAM-dependent methyltransferase [Herpetosiphonaceae bacterium]|nr:class I SAM-dependent methyltransferase [Herpetosiphonaceae bacterium]